MSLPGPLRSILKRAAARLPHVGRLLAERAALAGERDRLHAENAVLRSQIPLIEAERDRYKAWMPPGHYYSPVPSPDEIRAREAELFGPPPTTLPGVDLNEAEQWALLDALAGYIREQPFARERRPEHRYGFDNLYYAQYDAVFLHAMIRHLRPRRIVEVGCGHSSCVILDTNDLHFGGAIACTFIEPHPETLLALLRPGDRGRIEILERPLQSVETVRFETLEQGDLLVVDSTHVSKTGSDVNRLIFEILPRLRAGVRVHVHDVFFPFEYPRAWVLEGRAWNEAYLLRAFLQYNAAFRIELFNTFLEARDRARFLAAAPLCAETSYPGGSIWLRRT